MVGFSICSCNICGLAFLYTFVLSHLLMPAQYIISELQIRGSIEDYSNFFLFLNKNIHLHLDETVLMMGHNIHLEGVTWKEDP